ncbi:MAG TPA: ATPase, T2SS/T4P/T4SS family, partial [Candidatus Elarobacter sp.]|nr:ATPase, T2SS/T4P/T4SS family [Candidatus Elarobacter sp.]
VSQVQVNLRAGLTFPLVLRAFMRQDPDVVMVGEMRDGETAAVAVSAALAGQVVFTTLHANDAPRTIDRLVELGVARHSLAAALTAVVAQRLVRTLCEQCRVREPIPAPLRETLRTAHDTWYVAGGCRACAGTGYLGRTGVYELMDVDDATRDAIATGLIAGSGNVVHNLEAYAWGRHAAQQFDWAVRFESRARALLEARDHGPLIDYESMGQDAVLSVPTPERYLPLLYVVATQHNDERVTFPVEGGDGGSISMLSVHVG